MQPLQIGVIGAGVGVLHVAAYQHIPGVKVIALAGQDDDRVQRVALEHNIAQTFHDYQDLLKLPQIDAVSICVPNALHAPIAIAALEAGKHVLVEKPLARTTAEGQAMVAAAEKSGRILMTCFDKRFRGDSLWLKRYVESGALGTIYYAKAYWMRRAGIPRPGSWFVSKEQAGGGPLIDLGVHMLDLALHLLGEPQPLTVSASTYAEFGPRGQKGWMMRETASDTRHPYEVEDLATAFIRLDGGVTLLLEASWATHSSAGDDFGVVLYGTEGGAEMSSQFYTHEKTVRLFSDVNGVPVDATPRIPKADGHQGMIEQFVAAVRGTGAARPSGADGLRRTAVIDAAYTSAASGHEVKLG